MAASRPWDGKGNPPSQAAAIEWAVSNGVPRTTAQSQVVGKTNGELGAAARAAVHTYSGRQTAPHGLLDDLAGLLFEGDTGKLDKARAEQHPAPASSSGPGSSRSGQSLASLDTNRDGVLSPSEQTLGSQPATTSTDSGGIGSDLGIPALGSAGSDGAPLLPYKTTSDFDQTQLTFQNNSQLTPDDLNHPGQMIPARYHEADALAPLKWSPELRAQLQTAFYNIGLYGNDKVTLGSWGANDQGAFAELLKTSNVNGLTWYEQLANWKARPPQDLLQKIKGATAKPLVHLTNPDDIRSVARTVSQNLLGQDDPNFVASSVAAVNANESGYQQSQVDAAAAGGGQAVIDPGNPQNVLSEKLRREQPLKVDGNTFVNKFQSFLGMLGEQGGEH